MKNSINKEKLPKTWSFDDKKYKLVWKKPYRSEGLCADPKSPAEDRTMHINPNSTNKELVLLLLHEGLHAEAFFFDEETVERISSNLTELLDRVGLITK